MPKRKVKCPRPKSSTAAKIIIAGSTTWAGSARGESTVKVQRDNLDILFTSDRVCSNHLFDYLFSMARSFDERLRGFRPNSSGPGTTGLRVSILAGASTPDCG